MTEDDKNSENSGRNSKYGPGAWFTIESRTGFKIYLYTLEATSNTHM